MSPAEPKPTRVNLVARAERRVHAWRERRARRSGRVPTAVPFRGYGSTEWIRVVGRVLILPASRPGSADQPANVRGWRSFAGIPVAFAPVVVEVGGERHDVVADRGGVIDAVIPAHLDPGWQEFTLAVEGGQPVRGRVFVVDPSVRFGVVCDVDDTVMVTALPRPLLAAWNSFVVHTHARQPVPGMAVLLERLTRENPGAPMVYLSTGAWNIAPTLTAFLSRHLFPAGAMLLTDWGPTHDRWFRSGRDHKTVNLARLGEEFPDIRWLLIGDDGQHDDEIYTGFATEHPDSVAAVAIRRLSPAQAVLAGGRTTVDDHAAAGVPWMTADEGSGLAAELERAGILNC